MSSSFVPFETGRQQRVLHNSLPLNRVGKQYHLPTSLDPIWCADPSADSHKLRLVKLLRRYCDKLVSVLFIVRNPPPFIRNPPPPCFGEVQQGLFIEDAGPIHKKPPPPCFGTILRVKVQQGLFIGGRWTIHKKPPPLVSVQSKTRGGGFL